MTYRDLIVKTLRISQKISDVKARKRHFS